ncbi:MAG: DAK2 domain-containing protein [Oscillospiraceae bacterium]|nr:DAK2 domain-containing protein [Oscillospiraceae bacterium]
MGKDVQVFSNMIVSGSNNLSNNKRAVNELNVFPVPDGDTGTNMSLTAAAAARAVEECRFASISSAANAAANAALRGARGNSGVIMSQLLRGMAKELKGKNELNANVLAACMKEASDAAYRAVMNPTEGTILTVAREAAAGAVLCESDDMTEVMRAAVERGGRALKKTMFMLEALKKAGVVDAGGMGLMHILEGMLYYLENGRIVELNDEEKNTAPAEVSAFKNARDIKFGYCTEFIIEKNERCNVMLFKNSIENIGDCMLVIEDEDVVKVHIHTNHPGTVIENALKSGSLINIKIDNMRYQHSSIKGGAEYSENDEKKPEDELKNGAGAFEETAGGEMKKYGFAAVSAGSGFDEVLTDMGIDRIVDGGRTMNPSTEDILNAVRCINAENIFIFPNNKNVIMAAVQAGGMSDKNITVIPSKTIPESICAMMAFDENMTAEENEKLMTEAMSNVKTVQITQAVRDLEEDNVKKGDFIGVMSGANGSGIVKSGGNLRDVTGEIISGLLSGGAELITVYYGSEEYRAEAEELAGKIESKFENAEISTVYGGQDVYCYIISGERI